MRIHSRQARRAQRSRRIARALDVMGGAMRARVTSRSSTSRSGARPAISVSSDSARVAFVARSACCASRSNLKASCKSGPSAGEGAPRCAGACLGRAVRRLGVGGNAVAPCGSGTRAAEALSISVTLTAAECAASGWIGVASLAIAPGRSRCGSQSGTRVATSVAEAVAEAVAAAVALSRRELIPMPSPMPAPSPMQRMSSNSPSSSHRSRAERLVWGGGCSEPWATSSVRPVLELDNALCVRAAPDPASDRRLFCERRFLSGPSWSELVRAAACSTRGHARALDVN
jgi:hypothetical protein